MNEYLNELLNRQGVHLRVRSENLIDLLLYMLPHLDAELKVLLPQILEEGLELRLINVLLIDGTKHTTYMCTILQYHCYNFDESDRKDEN